MPDFKDARAAVDKLFSDALSPERFESWRAETENFGILDRDAFGEIFWRKPLGKRLANGSIEADCLKF
jgi:hypothetical protein